MKNTGLGISKTEAAVIRSQLRLQFNPFANCYEVFTICLGSNQIFKWIQISEGQARWYSENFNIPMPAEVKSYNIAPRITEERKYG